MEGYVFQMEPKGGLKRLRIGRGLQPRCWPEGASQKVSNMRHRVPVGGGLTTSLFALLIIMIGGGRMSETALLRADLRRIMQPLIQLRPASPSRDVLDRDRHGPRLAD
jgi:hypothetical protein